MVPFSYFCERSTHYFNRLLDFSVTVPRCYKDVYVNVRISMSVNFFAQGDSIIFLPTECFPITYDLNGFRPRVNWYLLSLCSFCIDFLYAFNFF